MSSRALIDGFSAILVLPAIVLLPRPDGAWIWLAGSWITHLLYLICLVKAFEHGDMSTAYPISRGTAPVLAAISAVGLFGAPISVPVVAGVLLVSLGTLTIAFRASRRPALDRLGGGDRSHHRRLYGDRRPGRTGLAQSVQLHRLGVPRLGRRHRPDLRALAWAQVHPGRPLGVEAGPGGRRPVDPHLWPGAPGLPAGRTCLGWRPCAKPRSCSASASPSSSSRRRCRVSGPWARRPSQRGAVVLLALG